MANHDLPSTDPYIKTEAQTIDDPNYPCGIRIIANNTTIVATLYEGDADAFSRWLDEVITSAPLCHCCGRGNIRNGETG